VTTAFKPLTKPAVADILGVSVRTIENWIDERILVAPAKVGGRVFWHPDDFYAWLEQQLRAPKDASAETGAGTTPAKSRADKSPLPVKSEKDRLRTRDEDKLSALLS